MKKLKLRLDGIKEMLSKEQMKSILGGYSGLGNGCGGYCSDITNDCVGTCTNCSGGNTGHTSTDYICVS